MDDATDAWRGAGLAPCGCRPANCGELVRHVRTDVPWFVSGVERLRLMFDPHTICDRFEQAAAAARVEPR